MADLISPWFPEPDLLTHQALGKLVEESAELSQIAARCLIQGLREEHPATQKLNHTQLMEEIADVKAAIRWLFEIIDQPWKGESPRERRKLDGFKKWQVMLEGGRRATPQAHEQGGEPATLHSETTSDGGVIRLATWPEGYVLWFHGKLVWRSWLNEPQMMPMPAPISEGSRP